MRLVIKSRLNTGGMDNPLMPKSRELDPEWLLPRVDHMCKYTFRSLENQTDKDFLHVVEVRPETLSLVEDRLRWPDYNLILAPAGHMSRIVKEYAKDDPLLYRMRLNSDDMLHRRYVEWLKGFKVGKNIQAIIPNQGYFWYIHDKILAEIERQCPPFYSLIYRTQDYVDGLRYELKGGHNTVLSLRHKIYDRRSWVWIVHDQTSKILRGKNYPKPIRLKKVSLGILKDYGQ